MLLIVRIIIPALVKEHRFSICVILDQFEQDCPLTHLNVKKLSGEHVVHDKEEVQNVFQELKVLFINLRGDPEVHYLAAQSQYVHDKETSGHLNQSQR